MFRAILASMRSTSLKLLILHFLSLLAGLVSHPPAVLAMGAADSRCEYLFQPSVESKTAELGGRSVFYEITRAEPGRPTFVVFNGLVFPLSKYDQFREEFFRLRDGEGLIIMSYSTQPESLLQNPHQNLRRERDPSVDSLKLEDFAREMDAVLRQEAIQGEIVPIGLSFGAAPLTAFLKLYAKPRSPYLIRHAVFIAPLAIPGDTQPGAVQSKAAMEATYGMIPFWGSVWIESSRDSVAQSMAQALVNQSAQSPRSKYVAHKVGTDVLVQNLKAQIRSVESFDLRDVQTPKTVKVLFVVAENENPLRRANQEAAAAQHGFKVTEMKGSQHATVVDRPTETASLILGLADRQVDSRSKSSKSRATR